MRRVSIVAAAVWMLAACGDEGTSKGAKVDEGAKKQCNALVDTLCERIVECAEEGEIFSSDEAESQLADCKKSLRASAGCASAVTVTEDYDDCLDEASALECGDSNEALENMSTPLPAICEEVIGYKD